MQIDVADAGIHDVNTLLNLLQYYVYDLSEIVGLECGVDGRFVLPSIDSYWSEPARHAHLIRVDEKLAGLALVHQRSRISGDENTWDMAEFFIMRKYRRSGVGTAAAMRIFDAYRGPWEVRELNRNHRAIAFWRAVIATYTRGNYREDLLDDERWRGPVQSFRS
jgi:predicted acetyltransferase